jgi:hypothetical protein
MSPDPWRPGWRWCWVMAAASVAPVLCLGQPLLEGGSVMVSAVLHAQDVQVVTQGAGHVVPPSPSSPQRRLSLWGMGQRVMPGQGGWVEDPQLLHVLLDQYHVWTRPHEQT